MKYLSHRFLTRRWLVNSLCMGLGNPLRVIVHHLLIRGMIGLGYQDGVSYGTCTDVYAYTLAGPMVSNDLRL